MKNYLLFKKLSFINREYIFIILTATLLLLSTTAKLFSEDNVFAIKNIEINGKLDLKFSREKYLDEAFSKSFKVLMGKILLTRDLNKIKDIKLKKIKNLISSFQILEEDYSKDKYKIKLKIIYNEKEVKKILAKKNISFSQQKNISVIFYPIFFINEEIQNFSENFFYTQWDKIKIKNEIINFILPLEDLDDISKIVEMKNKIENLNISSFVKKYNLEDYVFVLIDYQDNGMRIYLNTNFNSKKTSKNIFYKIENIKDQKILENILKDLKLKINEIWKEENLINLLMPLSIQVKFEHKNLENLDILRQQLSMISLVDNYVLEKFDINSSFFKIYYYGNPKKLKSELLNFGYLLLNEQGSWRIYLNE